MSISGSIVIKEGLTFSERVVNNWNNLDNKTVTSGSINIFKGNMERLRQSKEIDLFVGN